MGINLDVFESQSGFGMQSGRCHGAGERLGIGPVFWISSKELNLVDFDLRFELLSEECELGAERGGLCVRRPRGVLGGTTN